jgi:hypothetical protein
MPRSRLQENKDKLCQRTQQSPKEHSEKRNPASNQWEFYRDDTGYGQPKWTGDTQEIPRQQKYRIWESTRQIKETIEALYKHQSETKNTINRENSGQK